MVALSQNRSIGSSKFSQYLNILCAVLLRQLCKHGSKEKTDTLGSPNAELDTHDKTNLQQVHVFCRGRKKELNVLIHWSSALGPTKTIIWGEKVLLIDIQRLILS